MRITARVIPVLLFAFRAFSQGPDYLAQLPTPDAWAAHLANELMPFYTTPDALGNPSGEFPSTRCDDGTAINYQKPCPPIAGNPYLLAQNRYLVPMSRQTYGYGVAFHMTGDARYLTWMKAGLDTIRNSFIDRASGGMYLQMDLNTKQFGPGAAYRDPQQLGYGLLGMAFYYYLTRDDSILPDLIAIQRYIYSKYWNPSLGAMQWLLESQGSTPYDNRQLTACLDQMNTYLVLLAPILPEPYRTEFRNEMRALVKSMLSVYYLPSANLFFTSANTPANTDPGKTGVDVGHTSKALWMVRFAGLINGDATLVAFAEAAARRHLARTWIDSDGSWAQGVNAGGSLDQDKNWWVFAELDQLAATLSIKNYDDGRYLPRSANYWFKYFVDHDYGDVWNGVRFGTNAPVKEFPKAWQWKSAYHAFEHALVEYITSAEIRSQSFPLYFAFTREVAATELFPYYLNAAVSRVETIGTGLQKVTFAGTSGNSRSLRAVSAASYLAGPLSPGSAVAIFGSGFANPSVTVTDASGSTYQARILGSAPTQVNFVMPAEVAPGTATVTVASGSEQTIALATVATVAPAIFQANLSTSLGAANVIRVSADGTQSVESISSGISFGAPSDQVYLILYGTGLSAARNVSVNIRGQEIPVAYAGAQGSPGLDQINAGPLPRSLAATGTLSIVITADGQTANPVQATFN